MPTPAPTEPAPLPPPPLLSARDALFLDFDGTLVDLAPRPEQVAVCPHLPGLLEALNERLRGAVAVITGRWLADIDGLLSPLQLPGAGLHGAELRPGDTARLRVHTVPGLTEVVRELQRHFAEDSRLIVEDKGAAVALHYRQAPERADECLRAMRMFAGGWPELEVIAGSMVVEARAHGAHKGNALRLLTAQPPFAGRTPVFVGDDRSDEDAFTAAAELGGWGVKVGNGGPTAARYRCPGVAEVHAWLQASTEGQAA